MKDLTGLRFGKLIVIEEAEGRYQPNGKHLRRWVCKCDCGNIKIIDQDKLTRKNYQTVSCGCFARAIRAETAKRVFTTHGHRDERLYSVWCAMRRRCEKEYDPEYSSYGGRGISVCEEWHDYETFREWALSVGYDKSAKRGECTLDRIDPNGNYEPSNCRWANMIVQANNTTATKRYAWSGKKYTLAEIISISGTNLTKTCLCKRLGKGMTVDEALSLPLQKNQYGVKNATSN